MGGVENNEGGVGTGTHHLWAEGRASHAAKNDAGDALGRKRPAQFRYFSDKTLQSQRVFYPTQTDARLARCCLTPQGGILCEESAGELLCHPGVDERADSRLEGGL